jgi:hypothetical protein
VATVAVDFDGVIHAYSKGWHDGTIYDQPMPGALAALVKLLGQYSVMIFTTRRPAQVCRWFETVDLGVPVVADSDDELSEFWDDRSRILVTNRKLPAVAYIDDRAIRFENWDQALVDLGRHVAPQ